jgi:PAS domain S-box-containing protein
MPDAPNYADSIVETVREPLLVLDADLRVLAANRSFYNSFKVGPASTIGQLIYDLGKGQWRIPVLRSLLEDILPNDGELNDFLVDYDFPSIGRRTILLNARRLHGPNNKTQLILLAFEDITERRILEAEVARQRQWLNIALSSIGDAVIATDIDARINFMNPTAEKMTGWGLTEAMNKPLAEVFNIVNEETRKLVESPVTKAIRQGAIVGLANHTILISRDKKEIHIDDSAAPIRDGHGNITGVILVFHDITQRRQLEQVLDFSEVRYRRLFEAAHDGILVLNLDTGKIEDVNPFMLDLLGYPREHFIGKELWEIGVFGDALASQRAMETLRRDGKIRYEDLPLENINGRRIPVEFVSNVYLEDHHPVIQCNIRDISDRKLHERERDALLANEQASRMEAEAANRTKDLFLATLSHEMRTPLNAVIGWVSLLKRKGYNDPDFREGIDAIERGAKAQAQLIEDVLDVSRIVSGKLRLDIRPCQLVKVIAAAIEVVQAAADAKNIKLETDLDFSANEVPCDSNRIQQVVWNLLSNAVKFTPKGGAVRVTLERGISMARIKVIDSGRGIESEFLPYVFDRFRQEDSTTRRKFGGLGLGLSIAKQLIEMHGGAVKVESAGPGKGSTFTVEMPIQSVRMTEREEEDTVESGSGGSRTLPFPEVRLDGLRVLIVDDEYDARRALSKVLEAVGAIVMMADSAEEAMNIVSKGWPEVLLSDIAMPIVDGYDLIKRVRAGGYSARDLPAVALTAFAQREDQRRVLLAGFQVHVAKPVDPHDLAAVIGSLVGRTGGG